MGVGPNQKLEDLEKAEATVSGLPVKGYQIQTFDKVKLVNKNKEAEERLLRIIDELRVNPEVDQRWLAIGLSHIEQGFMAINRAIFKPTRISLED